ASVLGPARIILSLGITIALFPEWPQVTATPSAGLFLLWVMVEAGLGIGIGVTVAFISEPLAVGAQMRGLQAGYGFATTIFLITRGPPTSPLISSPMVARLLFF